MECTMKKPSGVLMFLLVILKVLGTADADCICTASSCACHGQGLTSVPQDLPTTITRLDLLFTQITTISQSDFSQYGSLETLSLLFNDISTINSQAFYHLSNLTRLVLISNRLTTLRPGMFTGLGNLEELHLYGNDISDIQAGTFNPTPQLRMLDLWQNKLTTLRPDMFTGLGNLQELWLRNNDISDIQAGTFNPTPQLITLYLHHNKLTILRSDMFTGLGNVQQVWLQNNDISDIQAGTFSPTPQISVLWLNNNKLTTLRSDMFTGLGNLNQLELQSNDIQGIQTGTFNSTPLLRFLYLHNNHIQIITSNSLVTLSILYTLRLSDNNITMFPFEDLSNIQTISHLYLHNNQMTTLPSVAYDILSAIYDVNITNNPWQCDCRMVDFRLKMTGSYPFEDQITCSQPDNLYGQRLIDVNPKQLLPGGIIDPTIVKFERSNNFTLYHGETLHMVCEASGVPTPDITVILPSGQNATVDTNGAITITFVTAADAGLYVCIAVNLAGSTFATLVVELHTVPTTVSAPTVTSPLDLTTPTCTCTFCPPVCVFLSPSKPQSSPSFSLTVLILAICGSVAGTILIVSTIVTIWCKRNKKSPHKRPDFSVVYNNTNTTATVVTNGQDLTVPTETMSGSSDAKDTHLVPRPASSQFKPQYEDVKALARHAVPRQTARGLSSDVRNPRPATSLFEPYDDVLPPQRGAVPSQTARGPLNGSNDEPPPLPRASAASAPGYENIPEHIYQSLSTSRNRPDNGEYNSHHYQSLRRT